jgi:hypothetical protein
MTEQGTANEKYGYTSRNIKWQFHCIKYNIMHSNAFTYCILGAKEVTF